MKNLLIILVLMAIGKSEAQEKEINSLVGKWELNWMKSGFFPEKDLLFESTSKELTDDVFEFRKDGAILHQNDFNVECLVGMFTLKDGNWKSKNGFLTLELRGEKIADFWYWWIIRYKVEKQKNLMWLKVDKVIKNRMLSATATWEELINE
jgi:hypothetical protein